MRFRKEPRDRLDPLEVTTSNRGPFLPLVLALDTSYSMTGKPIEVVNETLARTAAFLHEDQSFKNNVRIAVVTFGHDGVTLWQGNRKIQRDQDPFQQAAVWAPPTLTAGGVTPMAEAITLAVECVEAEKARLRGERKNYNRPVIWLFSDGVPTDANGDPTDDWRYLLPKLEGSEGKFRLYALHTPDIPDEGKAALNELTSYAWPLEQFDFNDVLPLLSASMSAAASNPDAQDDEIQQTYDSIVMGRQRRGG